MENMNNYEIMLLLQPDSTKANVANELKEVSDKIESLSGKVVNTESWGLKSLSYSIDGYTQGIYEILMFDLPPSNLSELDEWFKITENNIVRYLITKI